METLDEKIKQIEEEIRTTPYHKGTEHHIGKLKARIARFKDEIIERQSKGGGTGGFGLKKSGDATVVLVGPPSVGKSTLLNKLTSAHSKVAAYDFTTLEVIPGMMDYQGAKIQIFDLPGIIGGAAKGKGRGKEILSVAKIADLLLLMVDVFNIKFIDKLKRELYEAGFRLDTPRPNIKIQKKLKGGFKTIAPGSSLDQETIVSICREFRLTNGQIAIEGNPSIEEIIDAFSSNRVWLPHLLVINKIDVSPILASPDYILISADKTIGLDELKRRIWDKLTLIRVYPRPNDQAPDFIHPLILRRGATVSDVSYKVFQGLGKGAKVWGKSVKFPGQKVSFLHEVEDGDVVNIFIR